MSYRTPQHWKALIASLPPGLTIAGAAKKLGVSYSHARLRLDGNYAFTRQPRTTDHSNDKLKPKIVNWHMRDVDIARKFGVSRERVRQVRLKLGRPKVSKGKP